MIKTPLSTMIGGAFWTPSATVIGGTSNTFDQLIKSLFANGKQSFFYDPNDLSTMFQDAAGTVPVTAVGQPVGLIRDKSGRNNHAFQTNSASRPILRKNSVTGANYLEFDGSDDFLVTNSVDFTVTDEVSLFAGIKNTGTNPYQNIVELSATSASNNGTFLLRCPQEPSRPFYLSRGTVTAQTGVLSITPDLLAGVVLSGQSKISTDRLHFKVNGVLNSISTDQGKGNYGNYPIYIGRRSGVSQPFSGQIYALLVIGKLLDDATTQRIEKEFAKYIGVTL